jgi:diadenosine tetraphosphate (Ap4A) HIT family hydrolase
LALVFEAGHFDITAPERPHVSRSDGGHLIIDPKTVVEDRTQLTRAQAVELVKLTMVAGEAMKSVLASRGIDIGRINYQDNGNWRAELHVHLYGRARNAKLQPYGHALAFPPTREAFMREMGDLEPLDADDIEALRVEIARLLATDKYREF